MNKQMLCRAQVKLYDPQSGPSPHCPPNQAVTAGSQAHLRLALSQYPVLGVNALVVMLIVACQEQQPPYVKGGSRLDVVMAKGVVLDKHHLQRQGIGL